MCTFYASGGPLKRKNAHESRLGSAGNFCTIPAQQHKATRQPQLMEIGPCSYNLPACRSPRPYRGRHRQCRRYQGRAHLTFDRCDRGGNYRGGIISAVKVASAPGGEHRSAFDEHSVVGTAVIDLQRLRCQGFTLCTQSAVLLKAVAQVGDRRPGRENPCTNVSRH
jgi:hypothetical protein